MQHFFLLNYVCIVYLHNMQYLSTLNKPANFQLLDFEVWWNCWDTSLKLRASLPLSFDGWKMNFLLGWLNFQGRTVSFRVRNIYVDIQWAIERANRSNRHANEASSWGHHGSSMHPLKKKKSHIMKINIDNEYINDCGKVWEESSEISEGYLFNG